MNASSVSYYVNKKQQSIISQRNDYMSIRAIRNFTYKCIANYATYNALDGFYSLNVSDLPDFVQHEFASMIMADDEAYAKEATGPDNKNWESKMLPALTSYLRNSTGKDEAIEFNSIWRDCVTDYMTDHMKELIDDVISDFNYDQCLSKKPNPDYDLSENGLI